MKRLVVLVFGVALLCIYGSESEKISEFTNSHNDIISSLLKITKTLRCL